MKNIFLSCLVFLFSVPFILSAETEVYIYPVATDSSSYGSGDTLKGQFTIHNLLNERQSDVFYEIGISSGNKFEEAINIERKKFDSLFLESKSKRIVPFEYMIPKTIAGRAYIFVNAYSADGTLLALDNAPILIKKNEDTNIKEKVLPSEIYLVDEVRGRNVFSKVNNFYPDQAVTIEMVFPRSDISADIVASIKAIQVNSEEEFTVEPFTFFLSSEKEVVVNIPLPKLNLPGTYEINAVLESDSVFVPSFNFRYAVIGPTITFSQMNTSHLSFKKNKEIEITADYMLPSVFSFEDEQLVKDTLKNVRAEIKVINENEEIVFEISSQFDLTASNQISFKEKALVPAEKVSAIIKVFDKDNKLINEYRSEFPSEEQMKSWYISKNMNWSNVLVGMLLLLITIGGMVLYKKFNIQNKIKGIPTVSLVILGSVLLGSGFLNALSVEASTVEQGTMITNGWTFSGFYNEIFYSPLPQEVRSYNPGEEFDLYASIGAHGNVGLNADIRIYTQSSYCHSKPRICDWYTTGYIPPVSLYGLLSPLQSRAYYCSDAPRSLYDWFRCKGEQNSGFNGHVDSVLLLGSFTRHWAWSETVTILYQLDWLSSGLLTGSANLPATKEYEQNIQNIFQAIYSGIIREVDHNNADPTGYIGNLAHGWMFKMFSERCTWFQNGERGRFLTNRCSNPLLNFKYFYPGQDFVPERSVQYRKDVYSYDLLLINEVKTTIVNNNLPGANIVANFNFDNKEAIHSDNYNSQEFNIAIQVILDYLHELSFSLHRISYNLESSIKTQKLLNSSYSSPFYGHAFASRSYDIQETYPREMPQQGGVYKIFYYGLLDQSRPSWEPTWQTDNKDVLVSQTICVRGANLCPDEEPLTCPNLMGNYTEDENGVIYEDGVATDPALQKDSNGNCVEAPVCDGTHFEGEISNRVSESICYQGPWSCEYDSNGVSRWQLKEAIVDCSSIASPTVSCSADPFVIEPEGITTLSANPQGGLLEPGNTYTYKWSDVEDFSTNLVCIEKIGATCKFRVGEVEGLETVFVKIEDDRGAPSGIASDSCSYQIQAKSCTNNPDLCQNNIVQTAFCENASYSYTPTGELCSDRNPGENGTNLIDGPNITTFKFVPNIVAVSTNTCKLNLEGTNVQACRMFKNNQLDTTISNSINTQIINFEINTEGFVEIPVGTYTLGCTGTSTSGELIDVLFGSQKCILNPDFKEN